MEDRTPTYWTRLEEQLHLCGPPSWKYLLASGEDLAAAKQRVAAAGSTLEDRRLIAAVCHPDTGEPIPLPFRMAAHVPVNTMLLIGMLGSASSPLATAAWQWVNASFNVLQFRANRNASNVQSDSQVAASYVLASGSSMAVGAGLCALANRAQAATVELPHTALPRRFGYVLASSVAFLAAAAGKPFQIGIMRSDECTQGVIAYDEEGKSRGRSVVAGRTAVAMTIATRCVYLLPMLWLPFLKDAMFLKFPALSASPVRGALAWASVVALHSAYATPLAMAYFGQRVTLPASALEAHFRSLALSTGQPADQLWFNKGA